jgi:choline dehydrogenase-like flavoprotein
VCHRPFFKKSETFHPPSSSARDKFDIGYDINTFGTSGPIHISYAEDYSEAHQPWLKGLNSLGVETNPAHFSGSNAGVWANISSVNPLTKTRSFATEYLSLAGSNLSILTEALVEEIILNNGDGGYEASGVRFTHNDKEYTVSASREVILSAGTVKSPQLLELSGVGNPQVLSRAGIDVKVDSPAVGENLQEHKGMYSAGQFHASACSIRRNIQLTFPEQRSFSSWMLIQSLRIRMSSYSMLRKRRQFVNSMLETNLVLLLKLPALMRWFHSRQPYNRMP